MGQLIKLQDYVSRYEENIYNYPSRFVRLKKQQWEKTYEKWESNHVTPETYMAQANAELFLESLEERSLFEKVRGMFRFPHRKEDLFSEQMIDVEDTEEELSLQFEAQFASHPETVEDLKHHFLDQLFRFQMRWASSTLTEKSVVKEHFYSDPQLKFFLQRFPDNYLVLYRPIFLLKKAPVEVEVILISPTEVQCIVFVEREDEAVFVGTNDHFWEKRSGDEREKFLNPLLSLNRMGNIVTDIFKRHEIDLPVKKTLLSRNGYFDFGSAPFDVEFVEKRNYVEWFQNMRQMTSPLKHVQLKGANVLLQHCQTTSYRRLEWEETNDTEDY